MKDLAKIFARIIEDLQRFNHHLVKMLGKILTGALVGSFKIPEDSMRIFERSLRNVLKDLAKIFASILQDLQGLIKMLQRSFYW